jgi:DNA modification methylase
MHPMRLLTQELVHVPVDRLLPHPDNKRQGDIGAVYQSIEANGFFGALIVQRSTGHILAGNHRYLAAREAGARELPVLYVDVDDDQARRILLVDNRTNDLAAYDEEGLADLLKSILEETGTLVGTGFDGDDLDQLLDDLGREPTAKGDGDTGERDDTELAALQLKWGTAAGQVWSIPSRRTPGASHRLACGDSRDAALIARLMDGRQAQLVYTDPPYGVDYESDVHGKIENDALQGLALQEFLRRAFVLAAEHSTATAAFYIWHASSTRRYFERALESAGLEERQYLIWAKENFVLGRAHYHWQHEPCFYAGKKGQPVRFTDDRTQSTVWRLATERAADQPTFLSVENGLLLAAEDGSTLYLAAQAPKNKKLQLHRVRPGEAVALTEDTGGGDLWEVRRDAAEEYHHPTQKPVGLALRAIRNSSEPGDGVLDLFHGGGATLVACEELGRVGYANELDPRFVALGLERLAALGLSPFPEEAP